MQPAARLALQSTVNTVADNQLTSHTKRTLDDLPEDLTEINIDQMFSDFDTCNIHSNMSMFIQSNRSGRVLQITQLVP